MATPVLVMEWTSLFSWWNSSMLPEADFGRVIFDTHLYPPGVTTTQRSARRAYHSSFQAIRRFPYPVVVGEYALAGHDAYNWWQHMWKNTHFEFAHLAKYPGLFIRP